MSDGHATIVALSSGAMPSGIAVIRLSGPRTQEAVLALAGSVPVPRRLVLRTLRNKDGQILDRGLVVFFPAPDSFTTEDCAEFHVHGSRAVVAAMLDTLCACNGIEMAEPGAFTRRAFEAGKLDLTQIEGLGDLIAAETEGQRKQALARSAGDLKAEVADWRSRLIGLRAEIEARLDFSDEGDVADEMPESFVTGLLALAAELRTALQGYEGGRITRDGFSVVIAGAPNVGKSSLLNALAGSDEAIVSAEAGTTRDVKQVELDLGGQLVKLYDVAGLRQSASVAETEGVRRAERAIGEADLVLWLEAPDVVAMPMPDAAASVWRLAAKCDLGETKREGILAISSRTGAGIDVLKRRLAQAAAEAVRGESGLISHRRDKESIENALSFLAKAQISGQPDEIVAENLRLCGDVLARLTGEIDAEQVLDRLFAGFCIGK